VSTVLVVGGTGTAGSATVGELVSRGHTVRVLSRHAPVRPPDGAVHTPGDLTTGTGLAEALVCVDVVVSAVDGRTKSTRRIFTDGARALGTAARDAGVRRTVLLSIVGVDHVQFSYYAALTEQERIHASFGPGTVIVRSTQFHNLIDSLFTATARVGMLPVARGARFQPIAPADVGRALADAALDPAPGDRIEVGGPDIVPMRELAQIWKRVTGSRALVVELPVPGSVGRFLREGRNLTPDNRYGTMPFEQWLTARRG